jgi:hypothetical protein
MTAFFDLANLQTPFWTGAIYVTAIVAGLIAIGAFLELCDELITWCLGRFGVVLRIDLYEDEADERRRRHLNAVVAGRVR